MVKAEINELYWLNIELTDLERRLDELEVISSSKISDSVRGNNVSNPTEELTIKILKLKLRMKDVMLLILEEKDRIERFIETIPDSQIRTIVRLRNIDLLSWQSIGEKLGIDRKTVTKKYNEFIRKMEEK